MTESFEITVPSTELVGRRIVLFDESATQATSVHRALRAQNASSETFDNTTDLLNHFRSGQYPDLLLLNIDLFSQTTFQLLRQLRPYGNSVPTMVLSSHADVEHTVAALQLGVDDVLARPFAVEELLARIGAVLRRHNHPPPNISVVADLILVRDERWAERNGRAIALTTKEFSILDYMMRSPDRRASRSALLAKVWNLSSDTTSNVLDVYIKYLRDKIDAPGERKLIHTIRGFGYELRTE